MFQPPSPNELGDFFAYVVATLERLDIPYMVVGGFAAIVYGELRFTADVGIVVDMQYGHVDPFVAADSEKHLRDARGINLRNWAVRRVPPEPGARAPNACGEEVRPAASSPAASVKQEPNRGPGRARIRISFEEQQRVA